MLRDYLHLPRQVHVLCVGTFINRAGTFILPFLTIYLVQSVGLEESLATKAASLYGMGAVVAALAGGHLADVLGRKAVMLMGLFGGAAFMILLSMLRSPAVLLPCIVGFAILGELYRPGASAMIGDLVPPAQRPQAFGLLYVAINLGFAVGPALGGLLAARSFAWLFYGDAATSCLYGLIILLATRETLRRGGGAKEGGEAHVPLAAAAAHIVRDRTFMIFSAATFLTGCVYMQSMSTLPLHLGRMSISPQTYGWIISLNGMMIVAFQLPLTLLLSRFDRGSVVAASALVVGAGFGLTAAASSGWHVALTVVVWTIGEMMQASFTAAIVSDLAPPALRGRYFGVWGVCYSLAMTGGTALGGETLARWGGTCLWLGCLAVSCLGAALYFAVRREMSRGRRHEAVGTAAASG